MPKFLIVKINQVLLITFRIHFRTKCSCDLEVLCVQSSSRAVEHLIEILLIVSEAIISISRNYTIQGSEPWIVNNSEQPPNLGLEIYVLILKIKFPHT